MKVLLIGGSGVGRIMAVPEDILRIQIQISPKLLGGAYGQHLKDFDMTPYQPKEETYIIHKITPTITIGYSENSSLEEAIKQYACAGYPYVSPNNS